MISFDAMITEVTARLGNRTDLTGRIDRWINYAYLEITKNPRFDFPELDRTTSFLTVASTIAYPLGPAAATTPQAPNAPDFWFLLDVRDFTNNRKLSRTHWSVIDKIAQTNGQPVRYYTYGAFISLDPIPDKAYSIVLRYRKTPVTLTSGTNFDILGDEWEEPIVVLSTIRGAQALGLSDIAAVNRQLIEPMLQTRIVRPALEDMDSETTIEPGGDAMSFVPLF